MLTKLYRDAMRSIEREAAEPLPDPWAMAADMVREELDRRERVRRERGPGPLGGLSRDAATVALVLDEREGGRTFVARLRTLVGGQVDLLAGLEELLDLGLLVTEWAFDEDGVEAEVIVRLRYDVELPEPPDTGKG
jgi:hypothetical protein